MIKNRTQGAGSGIADRGEQEGFVDETVGKGASRAMLPMGIAWITTQLRGDTDRHGGGGGRRTFVRFDQLPTATKNVGIVVGESGGSRRCRVVVVGTIGSNAPLVMIGARGIGPSQLSGFLLHAPGRQAFWKLK